MLLSSQWCAVVLLDVQTIRTKVQMGWVSFHSFPLSDPERLAKWLSLMRREDFIPRPSSRLCSEHFEEDCCEPGFLLKREFVRGDGSYARKPKSHFEGDCHPHEVCSYPQPFAWRCSPSVSLAEAKRRARA